MIAKFLQCCYLTFICKFRSIFCFGTQDVSESNNSEFAGFGKLRVEMKKATSRKMGKFTPFQVRAAICLPYYSECAMPIPRPKGAGLPHSSWTMLECRRDLSVVLGNLNA